MKNFYTVKELAIKWRLQPRRVREMCQKGLIEGANKLNSGWIVPLDAKRPVDGRMTTGAYVNWRKRNKTAEAKEA